MNFWDYALPLMEKKNITQSMISSATGKPFSTVHSWIKRKCPPQADDAVKIAEMLGVSVRYLVTGDDNEIPVRLREIVELCRGLDDKELETVCNMLRGLQKRDCPESGTEVG